jgi:molecular chaperone DnaK
MLSKDDVDKMVREAQDHAEEDKARRDEVETRNQADALAFQADRTLRDLGDKVDAADRAEAERRIEAVREALKGSDVETVKRTAAELSEQLQKVATAAYAQSGPIDFETPAGGGADRAGAEDGAGGGAASEAGGAGSGAAGEAGGAADGADEADEAVEGEFKEV